MKKKLWKNVKIREFVSFSLYFSGLVCLDLAFRWFYQAPGSSPGTESVLFTLGWAFALTAVAFLLPRLAGRIFMGVTGALFGILVLVHAVLRNLFGNFFSAADLLYAGEGAKFFSFAYIQVRKALAACVILFWVGIAAAIWLYPKRQGKKLRFLTGGCALLLGAALIWSQHTKLIEQDMDRELTWDMVSLGTAGAAYTNFTNANSCLPLTGLYQYTVRDILVSTGLVGQKDNAQQIEELDAYFAERLENAEGGNEMTGRFAGKNVIFIMMESIDTWLIAEDYMPNLYAVQQESINFVNFYTPLYLKAGTFCTEFVSMTGIIPPLKGVSLDVYSKNTFPHALPSLFRQSGYRVNSFHPSNPSIYNRGAVHQNLGFEAYHNYQDMGMDNYLMDSQMLEGYGQMVQEEPFMDFIITISGHGPYDGSMHIGDEYMDWAEAAVRRSGVTGSDSNMTEYVVAVAQAMETDAFVGGLLERLAEDGLLKDTVLVFYADHYGKYMTDTQFLMELKGVSKEELLCNTPFFIYSQDQEPVTVEKYMGSVDIAPTIANLFGLPVERGCYLGDDAFSQGGGYVILEDGGWYDGQVFCNDSFSGTVTEEIAARTREATERVEMAKDILTSNYYAAG